MSKVNRLTKIVASVIFSFTLFILFSSNFASADSCSGNINCNGLISSLGGSTAYTIYNNVAALRAGCSCTCSSGSCSSCYNLYSSCSLFSSSQGCMSYIGCTWTVTPPPICTIVKIEWVCLNQKIQVKSTDSCGGIVYSDYQVCNPSLNYCTEGDIRSASFGCTAILTEAQSATPTYVPQEYNSPGSCYFPGSAIDTAGTAWSGITSIVPYISCTANTVFGCTHRTSGHTCFVHNICPNPLFTCVSWADSYPKGQAACEADHQGGGTGCDWLAWASCGCYAGSAQVYFKDADGDGQGSKYITGHCLCAPDSTYKVTNNNDCDDSVPYVAHSYVSCVSNNLYWYDTCNNRGGLYQSCGVYGCNTGTNFCIAGYCGDNYIDSGLGEVCESSNLNGHTCETQGLKSGTLKCAGNCKSFDTSSCCVATYGNGCGSCGGTVTCGGGCSIATPGNYGNGCTSAANNCGQTNSGNINCAGSCSASKPADQSIGGNCGSCGGKVLCGGSCSIATPGNYGNGCGSCGGTIKCDGSCSIATPGNYGNSCTVGVGECKRTGSITCSGGCSVSAGSPTAEVCDGKDNDCNGNIDNGMADKNFGTYCNTGFAGVCSTGTQYQHCNGASGWQWSSCTQTVFASTETCNGLDDDCNGAVDNGWQGFAGRPNNDNQQGVCAGSKKQCSGGGWVNWYNVANIPNYASPETLATCDGLDNNCNGVIDEPPCGCTNGDTKACGSSVGACVQGVTTCSGGAWGACVGGVTPVAEVCDAKDNDCDGTKNNGLANINSGTACTTGLLGVCSPGTQYQYCNSGVNSWTWSSCAQNQISSAEVCDGLDNNCDGSTDNGLTPPQQACTVGVGACQRTGVQYKTCNGASGWSAAYGPCSVVAGSPSLEICNGIDDNCDGTVDDNWQVYPTRNLNANQQGVCAGSKQQCSGGSWSNWYNVANIPNYVAVETSPANCDGLDNDCDGTIDEGCPCANGAQQNTTCGVGACQRTITQTCNAGAWGPVCTPLAPGIETCNGIDDNCDGTVDDNWQLYPTRPLNTNQVGVCLGSKKQCSTGAWFDWYNSANIPTYEPVEVSYDSLDNDCDGLVDEGLFCANGNKQNVTCGVGICQRTITQTCVAGAWNPLCVAGSPSSETCNNLDDDCNGIIDNGFDCAFGTGTAGCVAPYGGVCTFCNITSCMNASIVGPYCNDGIINGAEQCDNGTLWNNVFCTVPPNSSCTYCDASCKIVNLTVRCGDGIVNGAPGVEECDNGILNGWDKPCSPVCKWQDCAIGFVSNTPNCYTDTNGKSICSAGDGSNVTLTFIGPKCSLGTYAQVDFLSADGSCNLTYLSAGMTSQMLTALIPLLDGPLNTRTLFYRFDGVVPPSCIGKTLTNYSASLRTGVPPSGTVRSNLISGLLTTPIILSQCSLNGYIPYSSRIGFMESPSFYVPSKPVAPLITNICVNYRIENVTAVKPPEIFTGSSANITCSYAYQYSITSFCKSKGYDNGSIETAGIANGNCVKCYSNGPSDSMNGQVYNVKLNVSISGTTTEVKYACSNISDGVCPDDFNAPCGIDGTTGLYKDPDCGNHSFINCINTYDKDGHVVGNICTGSTPNKIAAPWCMIQKTLPNTTLMHTQCANGAVVQDAHTGCPACLNPGQQMAYSDAMGTYAYVYPEYVRLNNVLEAQPAVTGKVIACPAVKYVAADKGVGVQCYTNNMCDEGYRDSNTNSLDSKCNTPIDYNSTTGMYTLNSNCVYMQNGKYVRYCGIDSWYNNYEVYTNNYTIIVK